MAAAVASHLVKVDPETAGWWISLAYALRRTESVEKAEAILLRALKQKLKWWPDLSPRPVSCRCLEDRFGAPPARCRSRSCQAFGSAGIP